LIYQFRLKKRTAFGSFNFLRILVGKFVYWSDFRGVITFH
jgi:hypothetical protein